MVKAGKRDSHNISIRPIPCRVTLSTFLRPLLACLSPLAALVRLCTFMHAPTLVWLHDRKDLVYKLKRSTDAFPTVAVVRGSGKVEGTVRFEQADENSPTKIDYEIKGNDASAKRGMHVHQFGDNTNGCTSAGPHCEPTLFPVACDCDSVPMPTVFRKPM